MAQGYELRIAKSKADIGLGAIALTQTRVKMGLVRAALPGLVHEHLFALKPKSFQGAKTHQLVALLVPQAEGE
jgi:hypothetical protein